MFFRPRSEAVLCGAARGALAHGRLFRRYRRAFFEREGRLPMPQEVVSSGLRAAGFHVRKAALRRSRDNALLAWAARTYVERTAGTRRRS